MRPRLILTLGILGTGAFANPPALIPQPASLTAAADAAPVRFTSLRYHAPDSLSPWIAQIAASEWQPVSCEPAKDADGANLLCELLPGGAQGSYQLAVNSDKVTLRGADPAGLRHGLQTIRQLVMVSGNDGFSLVPCQIEDAPRFGYRGMMLDSARHIQSPAVIKRLLDQMALLKLNVFHWHLTDNNGWRPEIPSYPKLAKVGGFLSKTPEVQRNGYYTTAQMRDITAYAKARGIEVIPEIDVPGHSSALVEAYPEFLCPTNERPKASTWKNNRTPNHVVCVGNPRLIPFLTRVFKETAAATGATRVHIGGDEVEEGIWSKCPKCSEAMKSAGINTEYDLQCRFLEQLAASLRKEGLKSIIWLEHPHKRIPMVDFAVAWRGGGTGAGHVEKCTAAGIPVINAKGDYAYLDYPEFTATCKSGWMPTLPLKAVYEHKVLPDGLTEAHARLVHGGECTLWTEEVLEQDLDRMLFPRMMAFAEQMWTPDARRDFAEFQQRLGHARPMWEKRGVRFSSPVDRAKISVIDGAAASCSQPHAAAKFPEYALDDNDVTSFLSQYPAKAGDTFTVTFPVTTSPRKLTVITGGYFLWDEPNGRVKQAVLETTSDGAAWTRLTDFKDGFAAATLPPGCTGARLRLTADQNARMVVSDFRFR